MIRVPCLWMLSVVLLAAQDKPADPLAALRQDADKKGVDWDSLAKGLEAKIARLLPCDPRVRGAIEDVSRASEARLASLRQYVEAAAAKAKDDAEMTKRLVASQATLAAEMKTERAEAEQVRDGVEGQLTALGGSVGRRATLDPAQTSLAGIAGTMRQRAMQAQEQATRGEALAGLLGELDAAYQSRQKALETEVATLATETARWSEYYTARVARSQTECRITTNTTVTGGPASRPQGKKK